MISLRWSHVVVAAAISAVLVTPGRCSTCYDPSGIVHSDGFQPCPNVPTMCCALDRNNTAGGDIALGDTADECLPNGLCQNRFMDQNGINVTTYWRDFCTNKDWESGDCLQVCTQKDDVYKYGKFLVTPCDGTNTSSKWCCGESTDCCHSSATVSAVTVAATFKRGVALSTSSALTPVSTTSGVSSSSLTTTTSSLSGSDPPSSSPPQNLGNSNDGLSTGVKAGIGIGTALGALALLGLGFFIAKYLQMRQRVKGSSPDIKLEQKGVNSEEGSLAELATAGERYELQQEDRSVELTAGKMRHEMFVAHKTHELP